MSHSNVVELETKCCTLMCVKQSQITQSNVGSPINFVQDQVHEHKKKLVESVFPIRLYP